MKFIPPALLAGLVLTHVQASEAALMLEVDDGPSSVTITDGGALDGCALIGCITYYDTDGGWLEGFYEVNVVTGSSKPLIGDADTGMIDLASVYISTFLPASTTLTLRLTDTDFTQVFTDGTATALIDGNTFGGSVDYAAYFDVNNTAFSTSTLIADVSYLGPGSFSGSGSTYITTDGPYSLTQVVTVNHQAGNAITSFDAAVRAVPQPSALILIGSALVVMGFVTRRRGKAL